MNPAIVPVLDHAAIRARQLADGLRHAQAGGLGPTHAEVYQQLVALDRMVGEAFAYFGTPRNSVAGPCPGVLDGALRAAGRL